MKHLSFIFTLVMLLTGSAAHSQNLIAVQNGNTPAFYTVLDSAIIHAQNGDTVYIPGGTFSLNVPVTKSLHIIGVGHNPDSTLATGKTVINGNLSLIAIIPAVLFWNKTEWLMMFAMVFILVYLWLYRAIVKFQTPRWLRALGKMVAQRAETG